MAIKNGLISYWKLDETSGDVVDSHGSNTGTNSGATRNVNGKINKSFDFDGSADYVNCGNIGAPTAYTISCWVKIDDLVDSGDHNTYGFTILSNSSQYACWLTVGKSGGTEVTLRAFSASVTGHTSSGANLNTTDWFHILITATKGGNAKIYVNSVEKLSFNADNNAWAGNFTIGDLRPGRHICFDGKIDEVAIWNRVLLSSEITKIYNSGKGLYYPFTSTQHGNNVVNFGG